MPDGRARFRVLPVRFLLQAIETHAEGQEIVARIDPEVVEHIREGRSLDWVDATDLVPIYEAVRSTASDDVLIACTRSMANATGGFGLVKAILERGLSFFGRGQPSRMLPLFPRALGLVSKHGGVVTVRVEPDAPFGVVQWFDLPDVYKCEAWVVATHGALLGTLDLFGSEGSVTPDRSMLEVGTLPVEVRWSV